jgi:hypothetical protein
MKRQAALLGLDKPTQTQITIDGTFRHMTDGEILAEIEATRERVQLLAGRQGLPGLPEHVPDAELLPDDDAG